MLFLVVALFALAVSAQKCGKECPVKPIGQLCIERSKEKLDAEGCVVECADMECQCFVRPCEPPHPDCQYEPAPAGSSTGPPGCEVPCPTKRCGDECKPLDCKAPDVGCILKEKAKFFGGCQITCDHYDCPCVRPECKVPHDSCRFINGNDCSCGELVCCEPAPDRCFELQQCTEEQLKCPEANCCDTKMCPKLECPKVDSSCKLLKTHKDERGCDVECPEYQCNCLATPCAPPPPGCQYRNGGPSHGPPGCINHCGELHCCGQSRACEKLQICTSEQLECAEQNCCDTKACPLLDDCPKPTGINCRPVKQHIDDRGCALCAEWECDKECPKLDCPSLAPGCKIEKDYVDENGCRYECPVAQCPCLPTPCPPPPPNCKYVNDGSSSYWGEPGCIRTCGKLQCCPERGDCKEKRACSLEELKCPEANCCDLQACPVLDCPAYDDTCEVEKHYKDERGCLLKCPYGQCKCKPAACPMLEDNCRYIGGGPSYGDPGCVSKCGTPFCCPKAKECTERRECNGDEWRCPDANCCNHCKKLDCPDVPAGCHITKKFFEKDCEYACPEIECNKACPPVAPCAQPDAAFGHHCYIVREAPRDSEGCVVGCPEWKCEPKDCEHIKCESHADEEKCEVKSKAVFDDRGCLVRCAELHCEAPCPAQPGCAQPDAAPGYRCYIAEKAPRDERGCVVGCPEWKCVKDECKPLACPVYAEEKECRIKTKAVFDETGCMVRCAEVECGGGCPIFDACATPGSAEGHHCYIAKEAPKDDNGCVVGCPEWKCVPKDCEELECPKPTHPECRMKSDAKFDALGCLRECAEYDCGFSCPRIACETPDDVKQCKLVSKGETDKQGCVIGCPTFECDDDDCIEECQTPDERVDWKCEIDTPGRVVNGCRVKCPEYKCDDVKCMEACAVPDEAPGWSCKQTVEGKNEGDCWLQCPEYKCEEICTTCSAEFSVQTKGLSAADVLKLVQESLKKQDETYEVEISEAGDGEFIVKLSGDKNAKDIGSFVRDDLKDEDGVIDLNIVDTPGSAATIALSAMSLVVATALAN